MTTISFDIPDELAVQLMPIQQQLPRALSLAINLLGESATENSQLEGAPILDEIITFLLSQPSHADMIRYKVSPQVQSRLEDLLDKNRETALSASEQAELNSYRQANHLLILLKSRARAATAASN
jgi:hypothetical protein